MKISRVDVFAHAAPGQDMRGDQRNYVYVRIATDDGVTGWGEASCGTLAVCRMVEELGAELIGADPFRGMDHVQPIAGLPPLPTRAR